MFSSNDSLFLVTSITINCYSFTYPEGMEGWVGLSTMSVNNLLKVITRQRSWWDSNPRPLSLWSEILPQRRRATQITLQLDIHSDLTKFDKWPSTNTNDKTQNEDRLFILNAMLAKKYSEYIQRAFEILHVYIIHVLLYAGHIVSKY